jgi:ligand-binding sensor domain-containing protein
MKIVSAANIIKTIIEDSLGFLWVGTNNGLNKYDKETGYSFIIFWILLILTASAAMLLHLSMRIANKPSG